MPDDFLPPKPIPLVQSLLMNLSPVILKSYNVIGVDYDPADLDRLRALKNDRVMLTPNHPTTAEPPVMFHLGRQVSQSFYFLTSREVFDEMWGIQGWFIQRAGSFSVIRGAVDRASFRMMRDLLAKPATKMVVFPEGEVYSQNDSLLPFHQGLYQIAFWAMEDMKKANIDEPLYILPIALKHYFTQDMSAEIEVSLKRLETFTGVPTEAGAETYTRLRRIGNAMLKSLEHEYRLPTPKDDDPMLAADLTPRLLAIKEAIMARVAAAAGIAGPKGDTLPEKMRSLIYAVENVTRETPQEKTSYDKRLRDYQRERAKPLMRDLDRLLNWVAVYDGYVSEAPTQERIADTLVRLERECFDKEKFKGPRRCRVRIGEPLDLRTCWDAYQASKRTEVARLTRDMEAQVLKLLLAPK